MAELHKLPPRRRFPPGTLPPGAVVAIDDLLYAVAASDDPVAASRWLIFVFARFLTAFAGVRASDLYPELAREMAEEAERQRDHNDPPPAGPGTA